MTSQVPMQILPYPQTPQRIKAWIKAQGHTQANLAAHYNFDRSTLADLLNGRSKGLRGEGQRVAVLFGLQPKPTADTGTAPTLHTEK